MSEQKLVSPLLDGFQVGDPISSHDGVRCCPAIKENSDNKYIVKILSIPASQSQLDALLLAGAFQDAAGALEYFKDLADGVVKEVKLHQQLARLDGFVPCDAWQVVPMDDNQLGYEVYLLTPYHRTLGRHMKKTALTHLEAVNLGLDLCAALAASRRAGHLYVDLKPSNIFIASDREFLIGDLGFMSMDTLKYAALPSKYRSVYTAPEMVDAFATISSTADIYALGLIMYQVYNDGQLPAPAEDGAPMSAPANADYEMAEIILKACAPDAADRWQDPTEMGQALVAYMQRNTVNDIPIMPPELTTGETGEPAEEETAAEEAVVEETAAEEAAAEEAAVEETAAEEAAAEEAAVEETAAEDAEAEQTETAEEAPAEQAEEAGEIPAESGEEESGEAPAEEPVEEAEAPQSEEPAEEAETDEEPETGAAEASEEIQEDLVDAIAAAIEEVAEEESPVAEELAFIEELESEEPDSEEELNNTEISEEISAMLAQADELVAHEIPEPVVVTAPQLPEEEPAPEPEAEPESQETGNVDAADEDGDDDGEDEVDIPIAIPDLEPVKKKGKKFLIFALIIALLAGAAYGGFYYYQNYYLVPVENIAVDGTCNEITADFALDFDESQLTAVCTDTYGNAFTAPVADGRAVFTGLNPGTQYTITLNTDSFNSFIGTTSVTFTTDLQTKIVSISATTGAENGDVILSFTVDGFDPQNWTVEYATEGEDAQTMAFTGHMVTIPGLTVGAPYTFRLIPTEESDVEMVGETSLEFTASNVILAQNVHIGSFEEDVLTLVWNAPEGALVEGWTVRCTADGYDETFTAADPSAQFRGIEIGKTYSIEILADGMTQSSRTEITAIPLTITKLEAAMVNDHAMRVTWEYEGEAPAAGWSVSYAIDGGKTVETLACDTNAADLNLVIPGASYAISVQGVDTAAASDITFKTPAAGKFAGHGLNVSGLAASVCQTPSGNWTHKNVTKYTTNFSAGQSVSMVVYAKSAFTLTSANMQVLYVVRDSSGKVISDLCRVQTMNWKNMWIDRYFYPTLPKAPSQAGTYTFEIYCDGSLLLAKNFTVTG